MVVVDPGPKRAKLILVSGPSRGGKSRWAESLVGTEEPVTYIATAAARPEDAAWQQRLERHRQRRPGHWRLLECGADLVEALSCVDQNHKVLIDALGGFVAHHLEEETTNWQNRAEALVQQLDRMPQVCVVVIEETGWGVVPPTRVGGVFRDRLGELSQLLQQKADDSWLVLQGRAINLNALGLPVP